MDSNGQRFWMWSQPSDWPALNACRVALATHESPDGEAMQRPLLSLLDERAPPPRRDGVERALRAETELAMLPLLRDRFGTYARWDLPTQSLIAFGAFDGEVPRYATLAGSGPLDLALDADQCLLLAFADRIELVDLRGRFAPLRLALPALGPGETFQPHDLACDAQSKRYALDRVHRRLARIAGTPWPDRPAVDYDPGTFRPSPENPDAPRVELLPVVLPAGTRPVLIAASAAGRLAVAAWGADGALSLMLIADDGAAVQATLRLAGAEHGHALAWLDEEHVALRLADLTEVLVYALPAAPQDGATLQPLGRRYPSADAASGPFVASQDWPPHLPLAEPAPPVDPGGPPRFSRPLVPLAWRAYLAEGRAEGRALDTAELDLRWHRIYLEAVIPPACGVLVELAASDEELEPEQRQWHPHWFGDASAAPSLPADVPRGHWLSLPSELPHRAGLLGCPPQPQRVGLFCALAQRAGLQLRELRGRHLWLRVSLFGNGRATPELAAVRVWGQRFSYVRNYLPELYRDEDVFDRNAEGPATRYDFLERFTQLFEGVLTPLEDRIADVRVLTDPDSVPEAWLPWLAGWTGERFPTRLPPKHRRDWLTHAVELKRLRGTLQGLHLALDIATDGALSLGRIVIVEDFRLRRTMATLLGLDLNRSDDALLPGLVVSGNSFVGDTLILGDADDEQARAEFLALFGERIDSEAERLTVASIYERTAHRATLLVHEGLDDELRALVASIAQELAPAHVLIKVIAAREPFLVGVASLVGIDSYLRAPLPPKPVRVERSAIGRGDRLIGGGALDWRLDDGVPGLDDDDGLPRAVLVGPSEASTLGPIVLDGSQSVPPVGGAIRRWRFTHRSS